MTNFLDPSNQTEGGGLLDNVSATIITARTIDFDYPDSTKGGIFKPGTKDVPGLELKLKAGEVERSEFYPAGLKDVIMATKDGKTFKARPGKEMPDGLNKSTKLAKLLSELANSKFPGLLEVVTGNDGLGDFTALDNQTFFWKRRKDVFTNSDGQQQTTDLLLPVKYEGEAGKGSSKSAKSGNKATDTKTSKKSSKNDDDDDEFDVEAKLVEVIVEHLTNEDDHELSRVAVQRAVTATMKDDEDAWTKERRAEAGKLLMSDKWLKGQEGFEFDGKNLTLSE